MFSILDEGEKKIWSWKKTEDSKNLLSSQREQPYSDVSVLFMWVPNNIYITHSAHFEKYHNLR